MRVIRAYPIWFGGNSGPQSSETDCPTIAAQAGEPSLLESTTLTRRVRLMAHFDPAVIRDAIAIYTLTLTVPNHANQSGTDAPGIVRRIETLLGRQVDSVSTAPT